MPAPFNKVHLREDDTTIDFSDVITPNDRVAVIATQPLTDKEVWLTVPPGTLWLFHKR